ncbi:MAG TPA: hypothetical protein DCF42_02295 [Lachnospiraceae bacterium]|nr:hypothetical protein [Lachnospiraceae bacterium]
MKQNPEPIKQSSVHRDLLRLSAGIGIPAYLLQITEEQNVSGADAAVFYQTQCSASADILGTAGGHYGIKKPEVCLLFFVCRV